MRPRSAARAGAEIKAVAVVRASVNFFIGAPFQVLELRPVIDATGSTPLLLKSHTVGQRFGRNGARSLTLAYWRATARQTTHGPVSAAGLKLQEVPVAGAAACLVQGGCPDDLAADSLRPV